MRPDRPTPDQIVRDADARFDAAHRRYVAQRLTDPSDAPVTPRRPADDAPLPRLLGPAVRRAPRRR